MTDTFHVGPGVPQPPAAKKSSKTFLFILLGIGIGLVPGCLGGIAIGSVGANDKPTAATTTGPAGVQDPIAPTTEAAVAATTPAAPAGPATSVGDGTWTVGVDIAAGSWRPTVAAESKCYWAVLKSGTNGNDIISNNIGGGRPTVTLKAGQDFKTSRCGTWAKQ